MVDQILPAIGIVLGDHAGIGSEITAKMLGKKMGRFIPVVFGDEAVFRENIKRFAPALAEKIILANDLTVFVDAGHIYLVNVPLDEPIPLGKVSKASGEHMIRMLIKAVDYEKIGLIRGFVMASLTKQSLSLADSAISSEFDLFAREYGAKDADCAVVRGNIVRVSVTGHIALRELWNYLTTEAVVESALQLYDVMKGLGVERGGMAIAGLNPHAGENGLFGDEEATILEPAIETLQKRLDIRVIGPEPADTVFVKAMKGEVNGLLYLYHDQGNAPMKSAYFGEGNLIYIGIPAHITSLGHGSALDIAGKGVADDSNMGYALDLLLDIVGSNTAR